MPVSFDTSISALTTESQISFRPSPYIINSHLYSSNRKISLSIQAVAYTLLTPKHGHLSRYVELYHTLLNLYEIDYSQISPAFRKFFYFKNRQATLTNCLCYSCISTSHCQRGCLELPHILHSLPRTSLRLILHSSVYYPRHKNCLFKLQTNFAPTLDL